MSKRRNAASRGKTGRIKTATYRRTELDNAEQRWSRFRDLARSLADAPRLTSELGRLHFIGAITSAQYQAGLSFGSRLAVYDWKVLGVRRSVAAVDYNRVAGTDGAERWDDDRLKQFKAAFEELDAAMREECGQAVHRATVALCRGEFAPRAPGTIGLAWLVVALRVPKDLGGERQMPRVKGLVTNRVDRATSKVNETVT